VQSGNAKIGPEDWANGSRTALTVREPFRCKEVRPMDKKLSWTRIAISVAIDWRLLVVIVVLVLALLFR
jgi:hypothetical protein